MRRVKSVSLATQFVKKPYFFNLSLGKRYSVSVESLPPRDTDDETLVSRAVQLLRPPEDQWNVEQLRDFLFSDYEKPPLSPKLLFQIARGLDSPSKELKLFGHVVELGSRDIGREKRLFELYSVSKERGVSLTEEALVILMGCLGRAGMKQELLDVFEGLEKPFENTQVCNKLVDELLKMGYFRDALKVLKGMLEPNKSTCGIVFPWLLKRENGFSDDETIGLLSRFGERRLFPNPILLTQLIVNLCRERKVDRAWEIFDHTIKSDGPISTSCCNALLTGLGNANDFVRMNQLIANMKERGPRPTGVSFGILIGRLCKSRKIDEAMEIFEEMRGNKTIRHDPLSYNALIEGLCKVGRPEKGMEVLEEMIRSPRARVTPNAVTFNALIEGFYRAGMSEKAADVFSRMGKEKVPANVVTLNAVVEGMCRNGKVNAAAAFFEEMRKNVKANMRGNASTYAVLISAYCCAGPNNNVDKAKDLFDEMCGAGISTDAAVYHNLIAGLSRVGQTDHACSVAARMKAVGFPVDTVTYNILLAGFCRTGDVEQAHKLLEEMEGAGVKADSVTYNTLIAYLSKTGDMEAAHETLKKMLENKVSPTVFTYGALLNGYCINDDIDEATKLFQKMVSGSKLRPNVVIYNILVSAHCRRDDVGSALGLVDEMRARGVRPNAATYGPLFRGLRACNDLPGALKLMGQMVGDCCKPNYMTVEGLKQWLSTAGKADELRRFLYAVEVFESPE